jgi:phosphoribosylamine---glycine ligase
MASRKRVLVVGSGGREHALAWRLLASESVSEVLVAPGNAGTASAPARFPGKILRNISGDPRRIAPEEHVDLVVVGPEAPLCEGLSDDLVALDIPVFGPSRAAAALEGSKAFMKEFALRHGIRTARAEIIGSLTDLHGAVHSFRVPPVVKADGLCAGKGVVVASTHEEAIAAGEAMLVGKAFGDAGRTVVVEERLLGSEVSMHALCDGRRVVLLPSAQDHKRIGEGDTGPNTGGMGTYAPAPLVDDTLAERIRENVFERVVHGMREDGTPYRGVLFAGMMITPEGNPMLLEFNVRFGDPETQVLMSVLTGDLGDALMSAASGKLDRAALEPSGRHAVCVVLAAAGYPGRPRVGDVIEGVEDAERIEGVTVFHAGTAWDAGRLVTAGGRVLGVTGSADTLAEARKRAYEAAGRIQFEGKQLRRDIAERVVGGA